MNTEPEIATAVAAFNHAHQRAEELWRSYQDKELDVRLAERSQDADAVQAAKADQRTLTHDWCEACKDRDAKGKALCDMLGIDPSALKRSL